MMPRHPHCDGKLHFNVYRMDKLLACGVDGKLQSSLPMPSWSKHCSSRLSELPITSGKVAEHTGMVMLFNRLKDKLLGLRRDRANPSGTPRNAEK